MKVITICSFLALTIAATPAFTDDDGLRFRPGIQVGGFAMDGDRESLAWGGGIQGTLFKFGPLSLLGAGMSVYELNTHWEVAPFVELATIDFSQGPGVIGLSVKYIFRKESERHGPWYHHGIAVGIVTGF